MEIVAKTKLLSDITVSTEVDGFTIVTEPPVHFGGSGDYPPATRLVIAALLNCSLSEIKIFCQKRDIPFQEIELHFRGEFSEGIYTAMSVDLFLPGSFPLKYRGSIQRVMDACSVKKIVQNIPPIIVNTVYTDTEK